MVLSYLLIAETGLSSNETLFNKHKQTLALSSRKLLRHWYEPFRSPRKRVELADSVMAIRLRVILGFATDEHFAFEISPQFCEVRTAKGSSLLLLHFKGI